MDDLLFNRVNKISNHGIEQGITPRFIFQMQELHKKAFEPKKENIPDFYKYIQVVINDFTTFYDLHEKIKEKHSKYLNNLKNLTNVSRQENGALNIDQTLESELINDVKDFFIKGRILLNNWASSGVIKDEFIDLKSLLIVKDNNFEKQREIYLALDEQKRYESLFNFIHKARENFLSEFNCIRAEIEHNMLTFNSYQIGILNNKIIIKEPLIKEKPMYAIINSFYDNILNFIEKIMIFYYGINAVINWDGLMNLFEQKTVDYESGKYRYVILVNSEKENMKRLINTT